MVVKMLDSEAGHVVCIIDLADLAWSVRHG